MRIFLAVWQRCNRLGLSARERAVINGSFRTCFESRELSLGLRASRILSTDGAKNTHYWHFGKVLNLKYSSTTYVVPLARQVAIYFRFSLFDDNNSIAICSRKYPGVWKTYGAMFIQKKWLKNKALPVDIH